MESSNHSPPNADERVIIYPPTFEPFNAPDQIISSIKMGLQEDPWEMLLIVCLPNT